MICNLLSIDKKNIFHFIDTKLHFLINFSYCAVVFQNCRILSKIKIKTIYCVMDKKVIQYVGILDSDRKKRIIIND